jgi:fumarate hydratase class I
MEGVRRCILDAVWQAQGNGCSPGILGVCIGGDRASGQVHSKEQFLRKVCDRSPVKTLARLERGALRDIQKLGIGAMGLGGKSTLLGVKAGALSRLPASYFVTVSYMCWAFRRRGVLLGPEGGVKRWLY